MNAASAIALLFAISGAFTLWLSGLALGALLGAWRIGARVRREGAELAMLDGVLFGALGGLLGGTVGLLLGLALLAPAVAAQLTWWEVTLEAALWNLAGGATIGLGAWVLLVWDAVATTRRGAGHRTER